MKIEVRNEAAAIVDVFSEQVQDLLRCTAFFIYNHSEREIPKAKSTMIIWRDYLAKVATPESEWEVFSERVIIENGCYEKAKSLINAKFKETVELEYFEFLGAAFSHDFKSDYDVDHLNSLKESWTILTHNPFGVMLGEVNFEQTFMCN